MTQIILHADSKTKKQKKRKEKNLHAQASEAVAHGK